MKLEGVRVLDLSMFLPGPLLTQMMADHGAEVIKVETIEGGEPNRAIGQEREGISVYFANTHRGKQSLALDLKSEEGREILLRLAERSDVLVESFRPGVADRLGIGYGAVSGRNPRIVYASMSAFGQTGPYVGRPAHDAVCEAMCGVLSVSLGQDGKPWLPAVPSADMLSSLLTLSGVLLALLRRKDTGRGDHVDVAMMDSLLACLPNSLGAAMAEGRPPVPQDERIWGGNALYRLYETSDGKWIVLGGAEIKFAVNLLEALGRPDLIELCRLPPGPGQQPVVDFLTETFRTRSQAEWVDWFDGRDICFGPVRTLREGLDDPQIRARDMVLVDDRGWEHVGIPIKFRDEPGRVRFELPRHGEHGEAILRALGLDDDERDALRAKGVYRRE